MPDQYEQDSPEESDAPNQADWTIPEIADFYDQGETEGWKEILGSTMLYNFGIQDPKAHANDAEAHLRWGIRSMYQWIPSGARVLDAGCGWGGAARMLADEREARVHGVTISQSQLDFCRHFVPKSRFSLADVMELELHEKFDVAVAVESLTHMTDKPAALEKLRNHAGRIVTKYFCNSADTSFVRPAWRMHIPSHDEFRGNVEDAGFQIEHDEALEIPWTCISKFWLENIRKAFPVFTPSGQFTTLEHLCRNLISIPTTESDVKLRLLVAS